MRTRVKICGITRVEDAVAVAEAGADAIGLVFYPRSPRYVTPQVAAAIVSALPPFVTVVALFLDAGRAFVQEVLARVPVDLLQFHGSETPADCRGFGRPYIKAIGVGEGDEFFRSAARYGDAAGVLLDSHGAGEAGGTGNTFDWGRINRALERPLILAGGLQPGNVAAAIRTVRPWAVDLSSGVESAPGIKDAAKITALMQEVRRVDNP